MSKTVKNAEITKQERFICKNTYAQCLLLAKGIFKNSIC